MHYQPCTADSGCLLPPLMEEQAESLQKKDRADGAASPIGVKGASEGDQPALRRIIVAVALTGQ